LTYLRLFVIIWWLFDDYLWLFELPNRDVRPYSGVCDYLMIICNYWSYLITNNYQIMLSLFDDYFIIIFTQIIPIIQTIKAKYEYLVPFWQIIFTSQQSLFDDYLMIIWWLFDNDYHNYLHYVNYLIHRKITSIQKLTPFRFRQAMLPQDTRGQVCTTGKGYLWFAWFLTARRPLCFWMSAMNIVRMQGQELAITVYAFVIQESLCLLALRLTYLAPQIGGASETSASAMHQNEHAACHSLRLL